MALVTATGSAFGFGLATWLCMVWQSRYVAVTGLMLATLLGGLLAYCAAILTYWLTPLGDAEVMQLFHLSFMSAMAGAVPGAAYGKAIGRRLGRKIRASDAGGMVGDERLELPTSSV